MTISRRDTIILAVLVNTALLSFLFFMASSPHTSDFQHVEPNTLVVEQANTPQVIAIAETPSVIVEEEALVDTAPVLWQPQASAPVTEELMTTTEPRGHVPPPESSSQEPQEEYVEVRVKRGDFLEKIARANGTTVSDIKRINHLPGDRIDIGQILFVPKQTESRVNIAQRTHQEPASAEGQYYTIRPGDNPWTIARQHGVSSDDLLRLNGLDEAKARNLRPGDRIRVR